MEPSERRQGDPEMRCWSTEKDAQQFREYAEAQEAKCDALRAALAQMTAEMHTAFEEAARICEWEGNDSDSISRERLIAVARIIRSKPIQSPSLKDTLTTLRAELAQATQQLRDQCTAREKDLRAYDETYQKLHAELAQVTAEREELKELWATILDLTNERDALKTDLAQYRQALEMIAKNTCCETCQEAALVAQQALKDEP